METKNMKRTRGVYVCAFTLLLILLIFSLSLNTYATTDLQYTEENMSSVINYFNNPTNYSFCTANASASMALSKINDFFENVNASTLATQINSKIDEVRQNIDSNVDISNTFIAFNLFQDNNYGVYRYNFYIFIPTTNIYNYPKLTYSTGTYNSFMIGVTNCYRIAVECTLNNNNSISYNAWRVGYLDPNTMFYKQNETVQIENNKITLPFIVAFSDLLQVKYNNVYYYINNVIEQEQSYIEEQTISEDGFYLWSGDAIKIKLDDGNKILNNFFFVGDNLSYKNEYYYYNQSGDKIITRGLVEEIKGRYPQNGDSTGYIIQPSAQWVRYYDFYPNEIYEDLTIYYYSGDEILQEIKAIENKKVIEWLSSNNQVITGTTGTITNSSGDVIGNYSGDNDETDIIEYLTQQPNLENKTITQNDLTEAIGITQITNPYTNFWTTLLNGFQQALTEERRTITISFRNNTYIIDLDDYTLALPQDIRNFLAVFTTTITVIYISKFTKYIIDDISTASLNGVMDKLTDDFTTNFM